MGMVFEYSKLGLGLGVGSGVGIRVGLICFMVNWCNLGLGVVTGVGLWVGVVRKPRAFLLASPAGHSLQLVSCSPGLSSLQGEESWRTIRR